MPTLELSQYSGPNETAGSRPSSSVENAVSMNGITTPLFASRPTNWVEISTLMVALTLLVVQGVNLVYSKQETPNIPNVTSNDVSKIYEKDGVPLHSNTDATPSTNDAPQVLPPRRHLSVEH